MSEMKYTIVILGAGQLGSRYLQGLAKSDQSLDIWIVDPSPTSLEVALSRWNQIEKVGRPKSFHINVSIDGLPKIIHLAIVSTTANVRADVVEALTSYAEVSFWVLEKVLSQSSHDIDRISACVSASHGSWVNLPMRNMSWHKSIGKSLVGKNISEISITGGNWGLACNSLHYLDLIAYWSKQTIRDMKFYSEGRGWHASKRLGFYEVFGTLLVTYSEGLSVVCKSQESDETIHMQINGLEGEAYLDESGGVFYGFNKEEIVGRLEFQSDMTADLARSILITGQSGLPSFSNNVIMHRLFLETLLQDWNRSTGAKTTKLPIT